MTEFLPTVTECAQFPSLYDADIAEALSLAKLEKADATRRAYKSDFRIFQEYCAKRGMCALPSHPEAVAAYLAWENGNGSKPSTIGRRVASILYAHKLAAVPSPTNDERVRSVMRGIRRSRGVAPVKKAPAGAATVLTMCANAGDRMASLRDRALLLIGFSIAARRSELVALNVDDVLRVPSGLLVTIRRGKTDQEGIGAVVAIPFGAVVCPVVALEAWLKASGIQSGPIFRAVRKGGSVAPQRLSGASVANIVKTHAAKLGLDPTKFAGHSLRAGFVTSADAHGASIFKIMDVTRHKSVDTLRGYVRATELFNDHAGAGLL